jgi:hypothetical protein
MSELLNLLLINFISLNILKRDRSANESKRLNYEVLCALVAHSRVRTELLPIEVSEE